MKESAALVADACAMRRPARPPLFDIYQNDAVVAHFAGRPLDGSDDGETMVRAAAAGLDGTRHVAAPHPAGASWTDEAGNLHEAPLDELGRPARVHRARAVDPVDRGAGGAPGGAVARRRTSSARRSARARRR